ncbi:DUF6959 family protein [Nocardia sp. NPDC056000]|uniref:DUF6959 family protein n=1 Tax=Nocardia sp. NPDC056000 TaxID=3345674 RepID=UPI0035E1BBAB
MSYSAEIMETQGDYSLVKWEGRKFPGLLIQGDTLTTVLDDLSEARSELDVGNVDDGRFALGEALRKVEQMLSSYEEMMLLAGVKLPYFRSDHAE